jgi:hypothetical protein
MASTYDGQTIVSMSFKEFCEAEGYPGLNFGEFDRDPYHFHFTVSQQVEFDSERRGTVFEDLCPRCGNYVTVVGATPAFLKVRDALADGFYRTDILFASGDEKHPIFVIGKETMRKMKAAGFKGIFYKPVEGLEE